MTTSLLSSEVGRLRVISLLEGASYLALVGVAVPLKYLAHAPAMVHVVGRVHGLLFVLLVIALARVAASAAWRWPRVALALLAALLPGGAFVLEWWLRRDARA